MVYAKKSQVILYSYTKLPAAGSKIERVKLAQQAASVIIKNTCEPSGIKTFIKKESADNYINQLGKGIHRRVEKKF